MGVSFGVLLNIIVPNVFIVGFFVCMCLYLSYGLTKKAFNIYSKENENIQEVELTGVNKSADPPVGAKVIDKMIKKESGQSDAKQVVVQDTSDAARRLNEIIEAESTNF